MLNDFLSTKGLAIILLIGAAYAPVTETLAESSQSPQPVTVAFIGDQGINASSRAVLELIRDEGADILLHQGDLDYRNSPADWDDFMTETLGPDFPLLVSVGNHDDSWYGLHGYQARLSARLGRVPDLNCTGDLGVESVCSFRGLFFLLSGIGTLIDKGDSSHIDYIRNQLAQTTSIWRICSWHKNQEKMQVGHKINEVGWKPYKACRKAGAIVATAHSHTYSRTHLMDSFKKQRVASTSNNLSIEAGKSFAFVSGLGGHSIRAQVRLNDPWWASIYTFDQGANFGALFCTFFADGIANRAKCYFKDIDGNIPDRFELINRL